MGWTGHHLTVCTHSNISAMPENVAANISKSPFSIVITLF